MHVTNVGKDLEKISPIVATNYAKAKVAIVFSYDSYWALQDAESYSENKRSGKQFKSIIDIFMTMIFQLILLVLKMSFHNTTY